MQPQVFVYGDTLYSTHGAVADGRVVGAGDGIASTAAQQQRVHPVDGVRIARSDNAVCVAVGRRRGSGVFVAGAAVGLGPVCERLGRGGGTAAATAHGAAKGREHGVRRARVPNVRRVFGQRVTLDDAQRHAKQFVAGARSRGHGIARLPERVFSRIRLVAAGHHQLLQHIAYCYYCL